MSHARQTEHYELPLYDGTDIINPLTDFNNANETIDEAVYNANQRSVSAETIAQNAKTIAESYETRVTQAIDTANSASSLATNTQAMIADEFNPTKEGGYKVGDFVIYNGVLYRFINVHTGAWDASDVQVSPVLIDAISDVVDEGKQDIADAVADAKEEIAGQTEKVTKTQAMIAHPFDENKADGYAVGEIVTYADKLYKFTSAHSGAWTGLDVEQVNVMDNVESIKNELTWDKSVVVDGLYSGEKTCENINNYRFIYLEMQFYQDGRIVGGLIPIPRFKETAIAHMISAYYDNGERWVVARYVNDTTIAINYSTGTISDMHVWLVNY